MKFKTQKILVVLFFVVSFFLFSASIATEERGSKELEKLKAFKAAYPNTSKDYRGVVAIDGNAGCADELYCDFGSNGLWVCENTFWTKLNAANPDWIIGFEHGGTEYLLCDFGTAGLWYWQYGAAIPGQFVKITSANPDNGFASDYDDDGDDEIFLTFGANGLWVYDKGAATILTKIHATSPDMQYGSLRTDFWSVGHEEGALDFGPGIGLWTVWDNAGPAWAKINASSPGDDNTSAVFNSSDAREQLLADFGSTGLWAYDSSTWHRLTTYDPYDAVAVYMQFNAAYENFVSFNDASGLWVWDYATGYPGVWTKINSLTPDCDGGFCEPFDPNNDGWEEVGVDFGSNGLWIFDNAAGTKWTKINTSDPQFMIRSDFYCHGNDTVLVVDFGANGLWIYNGQAGVWSKLTTFSPDGVN